MKNTSVLLLFVCIGNSLLANEFQNSNGTYKIGDFAFGGIVFKVDSRGQHGLVCSIADQAKGIHWNDGIAETTGKQAVSTGPAILKETANDNKFKNVNNSDNLATQVCVHYSVTEGGVTYNDWYLPTKKELYLIYLNKAKIDSTAIVNHGTIFESNYELSPTEFCNSPAWDQEFNYGYQDYDYKKSILNVRAIRMF
jgi:hypothetical protein